MAGVAAEEAGSDVHLVELPRHAMAAVAREVEHGRASAAAAVALCRWPTPAPELWRGREKFPSRGRAPGHAFIRDGLIDFESYRSAVRGPVVRARHHDKICLARGLASTRVSFATLQTSSLAPLWHGAPRGAEH